MPKQIKLVNILMVGILLLSLVPVENSSAIYNQAEVDPVDSAFSRGVGPEIQISPPGEAHRQHSAVAYNTQMKEFLVVWDNEWPGGEKDIYARRITESGEVKPWFTVTTGKYSKSYPDVVYNATNNEYLVVWMEDQTESNGWNSVYIIYGRIIPWDGPGTNAEFEIISWPDRDFYFPKAAWDSKRNQYMVVWGAIDTTTLRPCDVSNAILSNTGTKFWGAIISTANSPNSVDVTYNPYADEYLAVWIDKYLDLYAAALTTDKGYVKDPPGIQTIRSNAPYPSVAVKKWSLYEIVWQEKETIDDDYDIFGKNCFWYMNFLWCTPMPNLGITPQDEKYPQIATSPDGFNFIVAYENSNQEIWAYYENHGNGQILSIADSATYWYLRPDVALGNSVGLVTYETIQGTPNQYHILGRLVYSDYQMFLPLILR